MLGETKDLKTNSFCSERRGLSVNNYVKEHDLKLITKTTLDLVKTE